MTSSIDIIRNDIELEWDEINRNKINSNALSLNQNVGQVFNIADVQYFVGDPESEIVMVHLNPKLGRNKTLTDKLYHNYESLSDHLTFFQKFGSIQYGEKNHKSVFDNKIVRLLESAELMNFADCSNTQEKLIKVMDCKFQIELIPFASANFNFREIPSEILNQHIERVIKWVNLKPRKTVLFCGKVFNELLKPYNVKRDIKPVRLKKSNGQQSDRFVEIKEVEVIRNIGSITGYILTNFAQQGLNQIEYGKFLKSIINGKEYTNT